MFAEPHIDRDPIAFRRVFIAGIVFVVSFWAVVCFVAIPAIVSAVSSPAACDGASGTDCIAIVQEAGQ